MREKKLFPWENLLKSLKWIRGSFLQEKLSIFEFLFIFYFLIQEISKKKFVEIEIFWFELKNCWKSLGETLSLMENKFLTISQLDYSRVLENKKIGTIQYKAKRSSPATQKLWWISIKNDAHSSLFHLPRKWIFNITQWKYLEENFWYFN